MTNPTETFTPEHVNLLQDMFMQAIRRNKRSYIRPSLVSARRFHHWSWRYGEALIAKRLAKGEEPSETARACTARSKVAAKELLQLIRAGLR